MDMREILLALFGSRFGETTDEEVVFEKGKYKTTVHVKFTDDGMCLGTYTVTKYLATEAEAKDIQKKQKIDALVEQLNKAIQTDTPEGYKECARIKQEIEDLEKSTT